MVIEILRQSGQHIDGIYDDHLPVGTLISQVPVVGPVSRLETITSTEHGAHMYICAIGNNPVRARVVTQLRELTLHALWTTAIHPSAIISDSVQIGPGTMICAGAIVNPDTIIGDHVIINTGAQIDHDCQIDSFVHLAPGTVLCGTVNVGQATMIGAGSVVINNLTIGSDTMVGSGSNVVRNLPDKVLSYGNPCRTIKSIDK